MKTPLLVLALASFCASPAAAQPAQPVWICTVRGTLVNPPAPALANTVVGALLKTMNFSATASTQNLAFFEAAHACHMTPQSRTVPGSCVPVSCVAK